MSEPMTTVYVVRGRSVCLNDVTHPPGTALLLSAEEARHLAAAGFVAAEPPVLTPVPDPRDNPASIGLQNTQQHVQGPVYR